MELIDKSKLLEGLKKLKQNLSASPIVVIEDVESLVESLEPKEVDLENELGNYIEHHRNRETGYTMLGVAKHFFELGIKAREEQI